MKARRTCLENSPSFGAGGSASDGRSSKADTDRSCSAPTNLCHAASQGQYPSNWHGSMPLSYQQWRAHQLFFLDLQIVLFLIVTHIVYGVKTTRTLCMHGTDDPDTWIWHALCSDSADFGLLSSKGDWLSQVAGVGWLRHQGNLAVQVLLSPFLATWYMSDWGAGSSLTTVCLWAAFLTVPSLHRAYVAQPWLRNSLLVAVRFVKLFGCIVSLTVGLPKYGHFSMLAYVTTAGQFSYDGWQNAMALLPWSLQVTAGLLEWAVFCYLIPAVRTYYPQIAVNTTQRSQPALYALSFLIVYLVPLAAAAFCEARHKRGYAQYIACFAAQRQGSGRWDLQQDDHSAPSSSNNDSLCWPKIGKVAKPAAEKAAVVHADARASGSDSSSCSLATCQEPARRCIAHAEPSSSVVCCSPATDGNSSEWQATSTTVAAGKAAAKAAPAGTAAVLAEPSAAPLSPLSGIDASNSSAIEAMQQLMPAMNDLIGMEATMQLLQQVFKKPEAEAMGAPASIPFYSGCCRMEAASVKVDAPHSDVAALGPVLHSSLLTVAGSYGSCSSNSAAYPPAIYLVVFEGCVQMLALMYHLEPQQQVASNSSSSASASEGPSAGVAAAGLLAILRKSLGAKDTVAAAESSSSDNSNAATATVPTVSVMWGGDFAAAEGRKQQQQQQQPPNNNISDDPTVSYCRPSCITAGEATTFELLLSELPVGSKASSITDNGSDSSNGYRLLVFRSGAVFVDEAVGLKQILTINLPAMEPGVLQIAIIPTQGALQQQLTPIVNQPIMVLPAAAAAQIQRLWQDSVQGGSTGLTPLAAGCCDQITKEKQLRKQKFMWKTVTSLAMDLAYLLGSVTNDGGGGSSSSKLPAGQAAVLRQLLQFLAQHGCWEAVNYVVTAVAAANESGAPGAEPALAIPSATPAAANAAETVIAPAGDVAGVAASTPIIAVDTTAADRTPSAAVGFAGHFLAGPRNCKAASTGAKAADGVAVAAASGKTTTTTSSSKSKAAGSKAVCSVNDICSKASSSTARSSSSGASSSKNGSNKVDDYGSLYDGAASSLAAADHPASLWQQAAARKLFGNQNSSSSGAWYNWKAAACHLLFGFQSPALESAYLQTMASQTFAADACAAAYHLAMAFSFRVLTDKLVHSCSDSLLACSWEYFGRAIFFLGLGIPSGLVFLFRKRILAAGRHEMASLICEWLIAILPHLACLGIIQHGPSIKHAFQTQTWRLHLVYWIGMGVHKPTCRMARVRLVLLPLLLECLGVSRWMVQHGVPFVSLVTRYGGAMLIAAVAGSAVELYSRQSFLKSVLTGRGSLLLRAGSLAHCASAGR